MLNIVHVTHEAVHKIGGIGAVLEGLITSPHYDEAVDRTILLCPLFTTEGSADSRLGPEGEVLYSSVDGRMKNPLAGAFNEICHRYQVDIVYGRRLLRDPLTGTEARPEVVLVGVQRCAHDVLNALKAGFYNAYGIVSTRYEQSWDFEQYVRLAEPGLAVVRALGAASPAGSCVIVGHEFMGMPTALAAKLHPEWGMRTAYYSHEVPPVRKIVEEHEGHDTMFYNVLRRASEQGKYIYDVFGDQYGYFRHALTEASRHLDVTLAVGDNVVRELRFLSPKMARSNIRLTYNGIPAHEITLDEALESKRRLQDYAETLLGDRPDYVFTHVTRMATSKGLWRDLLVMRHIDREFRRSGKTAVLLVLSTEIGGPRRSDEILHMERWWDWPVAHREGMPDLSGGEALFYAGVQGFNARARNCKVVFLNQFGFERERCGGRMPEEMEFWDIRKGSDVEFGQSIYEPFGIAQLEALSFGSICVMSSVCGCAFFAAKAAGPSGSPNVIAADYTNYKADPDTIAGYLAMNRDTRSAYDERVAQGIAGRIVERLPMSPDDTAAYLRRGYDLARQMSWDVIAQDYVLPAIREISVAPSAAVA
jgi:hypothetical protein